MPQAIPIVLTAAGAAASAATTGVLGATVLGTLTVGTVVGAGLSLAAAVAGARLTTPPNARAAAVEAQTPALEARPPKRLCLGRFRFGGRLVASFTSGRDLYSAYLIASHPCAVGTWDLFVDERRVTAWTGDPFSMTTGAQITAPTVLNKTTIWISGGGHTQPPQAWLDAGVITATDRWDGLTMVWIKSAGVKAEDFTKYYPRGAAREVQLLCDGGAWVGPAGGAAAHSATPAVIAYALMQDELGLGYDAADLDASSFTNAAAIEAAPLALAGGGTHPRYQMGGVIDLATDRGDFVAAIQAAAASQIVLQGGKWAYLPGVARQSVMTLDQDRIAGPPRITLVGDADATFNSVEGAFIDPTLYTAATNPMYQDTDAVATDGAVRLMQPQHPNVTDPVQAQRLDRLALNLSRRGRVLVAPFSGRAVFLTEGDVVTTNFGLPFWADGPAIVRAAKLDLAEVDGQIIETTTLELHDYSADDFEWSTTDEQAYVPPASASTDIARHDAPASAAVVFSGAGLTRAAEITVPHIAAAHSVEWEVSTNGGSDWATEPEFVIGSATPLRLRKDGLPSGAVVRWRLRYAGGELLTSDWLETIDYTVPGALPLPAPSGVVESSTANSITLVWAVPDDARIDAIEIYRSTDATEIDPFQGARVSLQSASADSSAQFTDSSLPPGSYRYWARVYDGAVSGPWSAPVTHTIS